MGVFQALQWKVISSSTTHWQVFVFYFIYLFLNWNNNYGNISIYSLDLFICISTGHRCPWPLYYFLLLLFFFTIWPSELLFCSVFKYLNRFLVDLKAYCDCLKRIKNIFPIEIKYLYLVNTFFFSSVILWDRFCT